MFSMNTKRPNVKLHSAMTLKGFPSCSITTESILPLFQSPKPAQGATHVKFWRSDGEPFAAKLAPVAPSYPMA
jgi:hypothetical protein